MIQETLQLMKYMLESIINKIALITVLNTFYKNENK